MTHGSALARTLEPAVQTWAARAGLSAALAGERDLDAIDALNARVVRALPETGMFMRQDSGFFKGVLRAGGAIVLGWAGDQKLGVYSVLAPASRELPCFEQTQDPSDNIGLLFGTAVLPELRGQEMQSQLIALRRDALLACGCRQVQATVAPSNHKSVNNLVNAGFNVVALRTLLDGYPRFVVQFTGAGQPGLSGPLIAKALPPFGGLEHHDHMLTRGAKGVRAVSAPEPAVLYTTHKAA